jgi:hypothetical protein
MWPVAKMCLGNFPKMVLLIAKPYIFLRSQRSFSFSFRLWNCEVVYTTGWCGEMLVVLNLKLEVLYFNFFYSFLFLFISRGFFFSNWFQLLYFYSQVIRLWLVFRLVSLALGRQIGFVVLLEKIEAFKKLNNF